MSVDDEIESSDLVRREAIDILKKDRVLLYDATSYDELDKVSLKIPLESLSFIFINGASESIKVEACLKLVTDRNLLKPNPDIIVFGLTNETRRQQLADSYATMLMVGPLRSNSIDQVLSVAKPQPEYSMLSLSSRAMSRI